MNDDPEGRKFLDGLKLDGFGDYPSSLFDNIREMLLNTRSAQPLDAYSAPNAIANTVNKE